MIFAAFLAVPVLVGTAALVVDLGRLQLVKMELQQVADAAARHGVASITKGRTTSINRARDAAVDPAVRVGGRALTSGDVTVEYGRWRPPQQTFSSMGSSQTDADAVRVTVRRPVTLSFLKLDGSPSVTVEASSTAYLPGVAFVVGNRSSPTSDDVAAADRLLALGFPVKLVAPTEVDPTWTLGRAMLLVSSTIKAGDLGTKMRDVPEPVVCYEPYAFPLFGMTGSGSSDYGWTNSTSELRLRVVSGAEFGLADGADVQVQNSAVGSGQGYGRPSASAKVYLTQVDDETRAAFFGYERGQRMVGPVTSANRGGQEIVRGYAPGRRIGLWHFEIARSNAAGWALFDAAIKMAAGNNRAVITVR